MDQLPLDFLVSVEVEQVESVPFEQAAADGRLGHRLDERSDRGRGPSA